MREHRRIDHALGAAVGERLGRRVERRRVVRHVAVRRARGEEDVVEVLQPVAIDVEAVEQAVLRVGRVAQRELADGRCTRVVAQQPDQCLDQRVLAVEPAQVRRSEREQGAARGEQRREPLGLQRGAECERTLRVADEGKAQAAAQQHRGLRVAQPRRGAHAALAPRRAAARPLVAVHLRRGRGGARAGGGRAGGGAGEMGKVDALKHLADLGGEALAHHLEAAERLPLVGAREEHPALGQSERQRVGVELQVVAVAEEPMH
mmetsp:Transcript_1558/g.3875  ORF Transcript_1558/g.3875 Transcript_1558/m.3875 type:complete len:262 (-) Transcript_1558:209-994(-)